MAEKKRTVKRRVKKTNIDQAFLKRYCNVMQDPLDPRDYPYVALGIRLGAPAIPKHIDYSKETRALSKYSIEL